MTNKTDHFIFILDGSGSMDRHKSNLVQVVDSQIEHLADKYKLAEQETRISVFSFSGRFEFECLVYDMDVLRTPSISKLYKTSNMTALIDASIKTIDHLLKIPVEFGDHAFVVYLLTDGLENHSNRRPSDMKVKLNSLPDNWTFAGFVPDAHAKKELENCGVPSANIREWNTSSSEGVLEVGKIIRTTSDTFKQHREAGTFRGTKSLFSLNTISVADIHRTLKQLPTGTRARIVSEIDTGPEKKIWVSKYAVNKTGLPYKIGDWYYELNKKETIQPSKNVILESKGTFWYGDMQTARGLLGLPDDYVDVRPGVYNGYTIFVQTLSINRNLRPEDRVLYVPNLNSI